MARIEPALVGYGPSDFLVPAELQTEINEHFAITFSPDDFLKMSEALAVSEAAWRTRLSSPDNQAVMLHLNQIRGTADHLLRLLNPSSGLPVEPACPEGSRLVAAEDAVSRLRVRSVRPAPVFGNMAEEDDHETDLLPDVVTELFGSLSYLNAIAAVEIEHVGGLDTLSQGPDSTHIDYLLKDLFPLLERNGLSVSYTTTTMEERAARDGPAVKLAMMLTPLWPAEIPRPTRGAVVARLVIICRERNRAGRPAKRRSGRKTRR